MIKILSWFLHHANRESRNEYFYTIKKKILAKYGKNIGYDVQFIPGKKCNSCGGTGQHEKYGHDGKVYDYADCYHCHAGWYKLPTWNILERIQFGKYIFHQPFKRVYSKPIIDRPIIEGFIEHNRSKHGRFALTVLFLIYEKGYLKRYYNDLTGWHVYWYYPKNWIPCLIYLWKFKGKAYPIEKLRRKFKKRFKQKVTFSYKQIISSPNLVSDDLPF